MRNQDLQGLLIFALVAVLGLFGLGSIFSGDVVVTPEIEITIESDSLPTGAQPGSFFPHDELNFNGLRKWPGFSNWLMPASSTISSLPICVIPAPKTSSSTLVFAGLRSASSDLTAGTYVVYRGTTTPTFTNNATSSGQELYRGVFADGVFMEEHATSTLLDDGVLTLFGPGDYLIFDFSPATTSLGIHQIRSSCIGEWLY